MHGAVPVPGDLVWIRQRRWRVERTSRDRNVVRLDVAARDRRLTFLAPFDQAWSASRSDRIRHARPQHVAARLASLLGRCYSHDRRVPACAVDASIDLLPHQLEPALAMLAGHRRLLIADDVGLGKTIQAALIIAGVCRADVAPRILVIVPSNLRDQWSDELRLRFGLDCWSADRRTLDDMARAGAFDSNPWHRSGVWIASPDFLKQRHVLSALPLEPWDLVVIDEAHTVCGESDRYEACHDLARRAHRTVLLTATPHSGDEARFQRLVALGGLGVGDGPLTVFRRSRADAGRAGERRVRWLRIGLEGDEIRALAALDAFERAVLGAHRTEDPDRVLLLLSVFRKRALSTMEALARSIARRLAWLGEMQSAADLDWMQPRLAFDDDTDECSDDERRGLTASTGLGPQEERSWLRRLRHLADRAARVETKVHRLASLLRRTREPVVVFTEFRDSQGVLAKRLSADRTVSVLHGGMNSAERRRSLGDFLDGRTSVLVATDVGGQGLNLQSRARWVINVELPWNPARLEQRIGRVDRIGQARRPHLTLLVARHEAETGLLLHLSRRVLSARRVLGADTLRGIVPDERLVRAVLLAHAEAVDAAGDNGSEWPLCRKFSRAAQAAARRLACLRVARCRWRVQDAHSGGPVWTSIDRLPSIARIAPAGVLVFSVPILSHELEVIERHVVAIHGASRDLLRAPDGMEDIRAAVVRAAARHLRRTIRREHAREVTSRPREQSLTRFLRDNHSPGEVQPGLFDRRAMRLRAMAEARRQLIDVRATASESSDGRPAPSIGQPTLEVALIRP